MATKNANLRRAGEANAKKSRLVYRDLRRYYVAALALLAVSLILFFVPWTENNNHVAGVIEQSPSGWVYLLATISGSFSSVAWQGSGFSSPIYRFAPGYVKTLGAFTVVAFAALLAAAVLFVLAMTLKKDRYAYAAAGAQALFFLMMLACMITALLFNRSGMYVGSRSPMGYAYCDPAQCTMRTWIYFPMATALAGVVVAVIICVRHFDAMLERLRSDRTAAARARAAKGAAAGGAKAAGTKGVSGKNTNATAGRSGGSADRGKGRR